MTENEAKEWFKVTSGKKVNWSKWESKRYVIPDRFYNSSPNLYWFQGTNQNGNNENYGIGNGFEPTTENGSGYWEWFDDLTIVQDLKLEAKKEPHKCTCPKEVWLYRGCQCGGI